MPPGARRGLGCDALLAATSPGFAYDDKRFRYFPRLNVFAVVNDYRRNAFALRLTR